MAQLTVKWTLNGKPASYTGDGAQPLLWHLRDDRRLTGTKYGCGVGVCGACTVLIDGRAQTACTLTMGEVGGRRVTTVEALSSGGRLHPVQQAWMDANVPQCGYCQAGQMMSTVALLSRTPQPTDAQVDDALRGNLCRCGTYARIRVAVHRAAALLSTATPGERA